MITKVFPKEELDTKIGDVTKKINLDPSNIGQHSSITT